MSHDQNLQHKGLDIHRTDFFAEYDEKSPEEKCNLWKEAWELMGLWHDHKSKENDNDFLLGFMSKIMNEDMATKTAWEPVHSFN